MTSTLPHSRLAESAYHSPYSNAGAPTPHPNGQDPYAALRASALATLEAMGYDPETMVERGVVWEDQDAYGHVHHTRFTHFLSYCYYRVMECYDQWLSKEEYDDMVLGRRVVPVIRKTEMDIKRQVKYPDSLIAAYRQEQIFPNRNSGTTSLFSLKQQRIVAETKGASHYMDVKTGRAVDIRTLGGGWTKVYDAFVEKSAKTAKLKEQWEKVQLKIAADKAAPKSKM